MFVKRSVVNSGKRRYEYLSLVEAFRDEQGRSRQRTIARLGEVSALRISGDLDRIIAALKRFADEDDDEDDEDDGPPGWEAVAAPAWGATAAVAAVWDRLALGQFFSERSGHLSFDLGAAIFVMVLNRLVDPSSKRRVIDWLDDDQALPDEFDRLDLHHLYRALDHLADAKTDLEAHLWSQLTNLTNLDLSLVCYDLTSTYFEGAVGGSERFPSKAFGYSRDKRGDRPQIVIGLLCTGDGLPIAHRVWPGNTSDLATLPTVLDDLRDRFAIGRICLVADRGLISKVNLEAVTKAGFAHIIATRLHRDKTCAAALEAAHRPDAVWSTDDWQRWVCDTTTEDGVRAVVVYSGSRRRRDLARTEELVGRCETKLLALEARVDRGDLTDAGKIGRAAQRILGPSGIGRLFDVDIEEGHFRYHYNEAAMAYEDTLAGHYVLVTDLTTDEASPVRVARMWHQLHNIEARFRVLKDFLGLRPIYHWTEKRVRGHVAVCVLGAVIEAIITSDLHHAEIADPDLERQPLTAARALRILQRIRRVTLAAGTRTMTLTSRATPFQRQILTAIGTDTTWPAATVT
ncbi:MAG: IS1634 family transposase [Acidimicrobiia bacterium]|nr:IS1634 family transposase [Acidimicrobiia bacterium]